MLNQKYTQISHELLVQNHKQGIKLIRPDEVNSNDYLVRPQSIGEIFKFPFNVFFITPDSKVSAINDIAVETAGFSSVKSAKGKTISDVANKNTKEKVQEIFAHDKQVIITKNLYLVEEGYQRHDDIELIGLSIKMPWYNHENKVIGLFGFTVVMGDLVTYSLANALTLILKCGFLNTSYHKQNIINKLPGREIQQCYFSSREAQCIQLLIRGKTVKEIAKILVLSPRTIEYYFVNIKRKMNVKNKSELIDKLIDDFIVF